MIYKVELSRIIQTINPIAFSKSLKDTNWQVLPIKRSDIGIFQKTIDDNLFQVTVPMDSSLIDYAYAMHEAVEKVAVESENIKFKKLPASKVLSIFHKGAYDEIGEAYAFIMKYAEENGYNIAGLSRECYIDGIWNKNL